MCIARTPRATGRQRPWARGSHYNIKNQLKKRKGHYVKRKQKSPLELTKRAFVFLFKICMVWNVITGEESFTVFRVILKVNP